MYDLDEYQRLVSETQAEIRELNMLLATGNSLMQMWAGMNIQIVEKYRKVAQKTEELEELCKGED